MINSCNGQNDQIMTGADQIEKYIPLLHGKRVAVVANQTSEVNGTHLVDTLLHYKAKFQVVKVFAPEHGFRGVIDDGVVVKDETDVRTGLPIISLYGKNKKPTAEVLSDVDIVIFDIQDVGARFYTFISTMHYVMEACAEYDIPVMVLDRPNPNGNYVDGPVLKPDFKSFVGMHPIPVVHGVTVGELAKMINGEGWLDKGIQCDLTVIACKNYSHKTPYSLPVKPSPNLPDDHTIRIYPSTCFFEGTVISEGRGTHFPFRIYGHPQLEGNYTFTPKAIPGMETNPKFKNERCFGEDLRSFEPQDGWHRLYLGWVIDAYKKFPDKEHFFRSFFDLLAGTDQLRIQIQDGVSEEEIRKSWQDELAAYKNIRRKYLLYD
ncbi:MAG TPA: DUF1343 domain-containing protein [Bacteroidales bacterium]|nr:DUF1343 domain-containing protein [Bacteroidales bacterium]